MAHNIHDPSARFTLIHDGQIHHPLGAGSYIFKKHYIPSHIGYLGLPLEDLPGQSLPPSTLRIHIGAQPNNSPHIGTMTVFIHAFLFAYRIKSYYEELRAKEGISVELLSWIDDFQVVLHLDLVDTAPHNEEGRVYDNISYQRSQRFTKAHHVLLPDYEEVMKTASEFVGGTIPYEVSNQEALTRMPFIPAIIEAIVDARGTIGPEISPETGVLAMRRACPQHGCGLAEKHGRKNRYSKSPSGSTIIEFFCPEHGYHSVDTSNPDELATLEFNTPLRNIVRSLAYWRETIATRVAVLASAQTPNAGRAQVHLRVTGADYTGTYSEQLFWRQLSYIRENSPALDLKILARPVIAYTPLILDWAGSKISKSLYVKEGAYTYLREQGKGYFLSFSEMKREGRDPRILYREVERWMDEPKKLFRSYTIEYLHSIFEGEREALATSPTVE